MKFWGTCHRRWVNYWLLGLTLLLFIVATPVWGQDAAPKASDDAAVPTEVQPKISNEVDGYPVMLDDRVIFRIRQGVGNVATPAERANIIEQRLITITETTDLTADDIRVEPGEGQTIVLVGETVLLTVSEADAAVYDATHPELAETAADMIRTGLTEYRRDRSVRGQVISIVATLISTIALLAFLRGLFFIASKLLVRIRAQRRAGTLQLQVGSMPLLEAGAAAYLLTSIVKLLRIVLVLVALYIYVPFVLSQFSATETLGDSILQDIAFRLNRLVQAFVVYLPNLAMVAVIAVIAYYATKFAQQIISELGRPNTYPWFYAEWIQPTNRLATILIIAIAMIMAGPYLPGFGSPAFQGVSLFIGALVTLGSSSAVSNALAGLILIYTRAFQLGDFIRINETIGNVQDKSLFVTRVVTPKQETVTIPNASVLNSNVVNYSAICRESKGYLLLYTTITLGYDLPWRKVHEVLVEAAKATTHIVSTPEPFVLQTNLNDFNVSYQLNAYTSLPTKMPRIYSELHQNIQDHCNAADIEILSPHFSSLRDGNHSTIPADYLPDDYTSPGFVLQPPPPPSAS
ncbi:mechanosensitive ion channel family protein [Halomicronema sp. CCY15110]|uniref:mechanosensitive ion channel family protein n=1 Tax=Halomicronema sp. CCY15110 TaxID=2767773 RepID=UPI001EF1BE4C|nr:mechanosensitive ion channel family protein [Halomicronema sp. CCY15110]